MKIDLKKLSKLANIEIPKNQEKQIEKKINTVIDFFQTINKPNIEKTKPTLYISNEQLKLRADKNKAFENIKEILDAVPSLDQTFVQVPRVLDED